ncbi:MAG: acetate--CoA ligase family protein [Burkholderiales bacterium]|nr:acetate--CoA ligase family protein [Burkholderiales bacterium]MDE2159180.1 acetate--CoA ligase family protein [Burkholderiales bacterium]
MDARQLIDQARRAGRAFLSEADGKRLLACFGIDVPPFVVATGPDGVAAQIAGIAGPYAVKVLSPDILHKSDAGGVVLDAAGPEGVRSAIAQIARQPRVRAARVDGYLVEAMCAPGVELVIGATRDRQFGPMIMVGLGGIFVEILHDVCFRLCPITRGDAAGMLDDLRGAPLLDGVRGRKAADRQAIVELLLKIGGENGLLMQLGDEIAELDLNPVIVHERGAVVADARVILAGEPLATPGAGDAAAQGASVVDRFMPLFQPRSVAVLGASTGTATIANTFLRRMKEFGYPGRLYPIHPKAAELEGLPAYPSLGETPEPVDYAYVAIGAQAIPDLLRQAAGRVRYAQVISSGFGEVAEGEALQAELVEAGRAGGVRILGPNCLGLYSPRGGVTFSAGAPRDPGVVGVVSQSGGLGTDIIKRGQWRGLRFSGLVTVGNSADIGPVDLLEFYLADPQTRVIGLYIEDIKDGRRCFDLLRSDRGAKPVVILRGGRSVQGRAAAASHTGALAGDGRAWEAVSRQTGCVMVDTVDAYIDTLLAFQCLDLAPRKPTRSVVLFGNGGGTSVLATDSFAECALNVAAFDAATLERLEALKLPPGTSVANPIDAPVATLQGEQGRVANRILEIVCESGRPDAIVMHINLAAFVGRGGGDPVDNLIQAVVQVKQARPAGPHLMIVLRVDGSAELDDKRRHHREVARAAGIPVYDELVNAAQALRGVRLYELHRALRLGADSGARVVATSPP